MPVTPTYWGGFYSLIETDNKEKLQHSTVQVVMVPFGGRQGCSVWSVLHVWQSERSIFYVSIPALQKWSSDFLVIELILLSPIMFD